MPEELKCLTETEISLISWGNLVVKLYNKGPGGTGTKFFRSSCLNISNNVNVIADKLPRTAKQIGVVAIRKSLDEGKVK